MPCPTSTPAPRLARHRRHRPADVHGDARQPRHDQRAARHPRRSRRHRRRAAVVRQRVHAGLRELHPHGGRPRRPLRPPHGVRRRHRGLHARLACSRRSAPTRSMLIVARAVQGLGAAAIMPLSLDPARRLGRRRRRPLAIGIWGGVAGLGVALGPLVGGAVVEGWNWQAIFWLNVPVGIIAIPLALAVLPNTFGAKRRALDVVGHRCSPGSACSASSTASCAATTRAGTASRWSARSSPAPRCSSASCSGSAAPPAPLLPLRLFRDRSFIARQRRSGFALQLRDLRGDLHPDPVPAGRAGPPPLEAAVHDDAVDDRADGRRADRRVHRAAGRAPGRSSSPGSTLQARRCSGSPSMLATECRTRRSSAPFLAGGRRHGPRVRADVDGGAREHGRGRPREGIRHELDAARGRRRARHRRAHRGVHRCGRRSSRPPATWMPRSPRSRRGRAALAAGVPARVAAAGRPLGQDRGGRRAPAGGCRGIPRGGRRRRRRREPAWLEPDPDHEPVRAVR